MVFAGGEFSVTQIYQIDESGECFGEYDLDTGIFTDQVWHKDRIFDVELFTLNGVDFSLSALAFREPSRTSLWRVSNGVNDVYIGGTIHILNIDDFPLPDLFIEVFSRADVLVTEISQEDIEGDDGDEADLQTVNPDGLLSEILLPETLQRVHVFLDQFGVTLDPVDDLLPYWAGRAFLQLKMYSLGYGPGVDFAFQYLAQELDIPNLGLETAVSQVEAINTRELSSATADEVILAAIDAAESDEYFAFLDFMIDSWRQGDMGFFKYLNDLEKAEDEEGYNLILSNRNKAWIPQIEAMLETAEIEIILVGTGHLAGDDNVLQLLEDLGYTVERYR